MTLVALKIQYIRIKITVHNNRTRRSFSTFAAVIMDLANKQYIEQHKIHLLKDWAGFSSVILKRACFYTMYLFIT